MFRYAQIDLVTFKCFSVANLNMEIILPQLIRLTDDEPSPLGMIYDPANQTWSPDPNDEEN